ncbi:MAG: hydroxyacid dehydrogenase [Nitratireductor sp.]
MAEVVITEFMDAQAVSMLREKHDVVYDPGLADRQDAIPDLLEDCRALIVRNRTQVTKKLLQAAPLLKCVGRLGVGLDNIDVDACRNAGVAVYPATGANNLAVVEYVLATALILLRGAYQSNAAMISGQWPRQSLMGHEISGKTLGLVGFGAIAQEAARRAAALGMKIVAHDPFLAESHPAWRPVERLSLDALLSVSDVVSLHVPLTDQTRHQIDADALKLMKKESVLINAARGGVVDEAALAHALSSGAIAGAALDVFETEPLTAAQGKRFEGLKNVILTPHIAGVTTESNVRVSELIADLVLGHL